MEKHQMRLESVVVSDDVVRAISYKRGYLWIGDGKSGYCFGILNEHKTVRMAKAILRRAALLAKR